MIVTFPGQFWANEIASLSEWRRKREWWVFLKEVGLRRGGFVMLSPRRASSISASSAKHGRHPPLSPSTLLYITLTSWQTNFPTIILALFRLPAPGADFHGKIRRSLRGPSPTVRKWSTFIVNKLLNPRCSKDFVGRRIVQALCKKILHTKQIGTYKGNRIRYPKARSLKCNFIIII